LKTVRDFGGWKRKRVLANALLIDGIIGGAGKKEDEGETKEKGGVG